MEGAGDVAAGVAGIAVDEFWVAPVPIGAGTVFEDTAPAVSWAPTGTVDDASGDDDGPSGSDGGS